LEENAQGDDEAEDEGAGCRNRTALLLFPHPYSFQQLRQEIKQILFK
jgi:hypothetical protein